MNKPFNLEETKINLAKHKERIQTLQNKLKAKLKIKADDMGEDCCEEPEKDEYLYFLTEYLLNWIMDVEKSLYSYVYSHAEGHIPPILGAEKMQTALNKLGIGQDYDVKKPVIYASVEVKNDRLGKTFTV